MPFGWGRCNLSSERKIFVSAQKLAQKWGWGLVSVLMLGAIWARWQYIQAEVFHVDEFISMLAIKMTLDTGQPILPSGLFYDHGLIFSYVGAGVAWLAQGDLLAVRWWSLAVSVATVAVSYWLCQRLFGAGVWGILAVVGFAFHPDAVEWGGRVRMYSQANLLLVASLGLFWLATFGGGQRWARWAFVGVVWLALSTHFVLVLTLPPLVLAAMLVWYFYPHPNSLPKGERMREGDLSLKTQGQTIFKKLTLLTNRRLWLELGLMGLVIASAVWVNRGSFIARYAAESSQPALTAETTLTPEAQVIDIAFDPARWGAMWRYLTQADMLPFAILAGLGGIWAGIAVARRRASRADLVALWLVLMLAGIIAGVTLGLSDEWRKTRYNFLILFPILLPLAVYGLQQLAHWLTERVSSPVLIRLMLLVLFLGLGVVWPLLGFGNELLSVVRGQTDSPNQYPLALRYVDDHRQPDDTLATIRPAAGWLFSRQLDYYVNQATPVIIPTENAWVDRYAGVPYLPDVPALNPVIDAPGRLWLVADDVRLFEYFSPAFTQQILYRLTPAAEIGNMYALVERDSGPLVSVEPTARFAGQWADGTQLGGYAVLPAWGAGQTSQLTTFWQASEEILGHKIFVHLRDETGATVAQADFEPLFQIEPRLRPALIEQVNEMPDSWLRLVVNLSLPAELEAAQYHLFIGLYDPQTGERLAVVDDRSGENAFIIEGAELE